MFETSDIRGLLIWCILFFWRLFYKLSRDQLDPWIIVDLSSSSYLQGIPCAHPLPTIEYLRWVGLKVTPLLDSLLFA